MTSSIFSSSALGERGFCNMKYVKLIFFKPIILQDLMKNPTKIILKKKKKDNSPDYRNRKKGIDGPDLFFSY